MSDSISRKEILRTLPNLCIGFDCLNCPFHNGDDMTRNCLLEQWANSLPSAEPERKKGKWIVTSEFSDCYYAKCNQCNVTQIFYYGKPLTNYCPNCGADMREGERITNG